MTGSKLGEERRTGQEPIPEDIRSRLNELQHQTLVRLSGFGWSMQFVRRPLFQDLVIVVIDPSGTDRAVLREDGSIDRDFDLQIR